MVPPSKILLVTFVFDFKDYVASPILTYLAGVQINGRSKE